jgi:PHD/YefM family antitoxin component YafN of YafNO toxin-antitoxin module
MVAVDKHGRPVVVVIAVEVEEYERLKKMEKAKRPASTEGKKL